MNEHIENINLKLSIITINYNNLEGLKRTVESIVNQSWKEFEYILIDGGSKDGSSEYIKEHSYYFDYSISELDTGIYNAMNKGINVANGQYLLFLNSGDYLYNEFVLKNIFEETLNEDIIYGNIFWETNGKHSEGIFPKNLSFNYFRNYSLPHQASFIQKNIFQKIGLYDENIPIISDWIFFVLAICKYNCSYRNLNMIVSVCNRNGISCDENNWEQILNNRKKVLVSYFPAFLYDYHNYDSIHEELVILKKSLMKNKYSFSYKNYLKKIFSKLFTSNTD